MEWKTPGRNSRHITNDNVNRADAFAYRQRVTNMLAGLARKFGPNLRESGDMFGIEQPLLEVLGGIERVRLASEREAHQEAIARIDEELAALHA